MCELCTSGSVEAWVGDRGAFPEADQSCHSGSPEFNVSPGGPTAELCRQAALHGGYVRAIDANQSY
jgi:hypothetical protein